MNIWERYKEHYEIEINIILVLQMNHIFICSLSYIIIQLTIFYLL